MVGWGAEMGNEWERRSSAKGGPKLRGVYPQALRHFSLQECKIMRSGARRGFSGVGDGRGKGKQATRAVVRAAFRVGHVSWEGHIQEGLPGRRAVTPIAGRFVGTEIHASVWLTWDHGGGEGRQSQPLCPGTHLCGRGWTNVHICLYMGGGTSCAGNRRA